MARISYRCLPEERGVPISQKSFWKIYRGDKEIGCIKSDENAKLIAPNLRVWEPVIYESEFDPMEFPHSDDAEGMKEPYVCTNDDEECEHQLELHPNSKMTLNESRTWVRNITRSE